MQILIVSNDETKTALQKVKIIIVIYIANKRSAKNEKNMQIIE